jgi:hypothetical protein
MIFSAEAEPGKNDVAQCISSLIFVWAAFQFSASESNSICTSVAVWPRLDFMMRDVTVGLGHGRGGGETERWLKVLNFSCLVSGIRPVGQKAHNGESSR